MASPVSATAGRSIWTQLPGEPIHGTMSPTGVPTALERVGRLQRVVSQEYRMDLQIAACQKGDWHGYWDVELADGARLTVYRDLTKGGWYVLP